MGFNFQYGKIIFNNAFNKNGFRLLEKEFIPMFKAGLTCKGAVTLKRVKIEGPQGIQTISTYLDKNGRALERRRVNDYSNITETAVFKWFSTKQKKFGHNGVITHKLKYDNNLLEQKVDTIDINKRNNIVTRSYNHKYFTDSNQTIEKSGVAETISGKTNKKIEKTVLTDSKGNKLDEKVMSHGVNDKDVAKVTSEPYFLARFKHCPNFAEAISLIAQKQQNVRFRTSIFSSVRTDNNLGSYCHDLKKIRLKWDKDWGLSEFEPKAGYVNTINHEYRHAYQHQLVDDLKAGKLTTQKEIEQAKEFLENFNHYCQPEKNYAQYWNQLVEADARNAGRKVASEYSFNTFNLRTIFENALDITLGG